jgi:3-deoxy-D-manno-octulosonic-acid transferase
MLRSIYRLLLILAYPLVRVRLRWRARREPGYGERVDERFGYLGADLPRGAVWFHTVSAGETIAAVPLIQTLIDEFPEMPFLVTTMTPAGSAQVRQRLGDRVAHCYAPYDFRAGVERAFARLQPRLLVLMETELWPNLIDVADQRRVPVILINARLSARSARGYARIGALTRDMLGKLRFIACQYPDHAQRFLDLGAASNVVRAMGNIKFDVRLPVDHATELARMRRQWQLAGRPVWIAASTHPGEEAVVIEAHRLLRETIPGACLLLAPRHPERADSVVSLVKSAGLSVVRQSRITAALSDEPAVLLCDSMGQLQYLYGLSRVAFLGGSLVSVGGHNPIEAAICGQPLIMGPETFNFSDVVAAFSDAECLFTVTNAQDLADRLRGLLEDEALRSRLGAAARRVVAENTGGTERLLELLRTEIRARSVVQQ